jgi:hypothetical protein
MTTKSRTALLQMKVSTAGRTFEAIIPEEQEKSGALSGGKSVKPATVKAEGRRTVVTVMKTATRLK